MPECDHDECGQKCKRELASSAGSEISDTQRLDWLIKQGLPGACDDGYGLSDSLWEGATDFVDANDDKKDNTDRKCVRAAIDAAMFPNDLLCIRRAWAGPSADTFDVPPIAGFVQKYLLKSKVSIDPFARNKRWATYTNDLNPQTAATEHMDAEDFLRQLAERGIKADLVIFDPPYSPRQIAECYAGVERTVTMQDTQNCVLYSRVRSRIPAVLQEGGVVLSFGWNSNGMGKQHGMEIIEILMVAHGAAHNDTICVAEKKDSQSTGGVTVMHNGRMRDGGQRQ